MLKHGLLSLCCVLFASEAFAGAADYQKEISEWREQRLARLTAPDGWLTLAAQLWLKDGAHSLGSAESCALRLPGGPAVLGLLEVDLANGKVRLALEPGVDARIGAAGLRSAELANDTSGTPTLVTAGTLSLFVIKRGERLALRVKDSAAPARVGFKGLEHFPTDPAWRIEARWVPFGPGHTISVTNVIGQTTNEPAPGKAVFEKEGRAYELTPTQDKPGEELFFVLRDLTSGKETYGASRFLYADAPKDGKVVLDFNKAFNPPCAFSEFATCPLPPEGNRLKLRITAGEKKYHNP